MAAERILPSQRNAEIHCSRIEPDPAAAVLPLSHSRRPFLGLKKTGQLLQRALILRPGGMVQLGETRHVFRFQRGVASLTFQLESGSPRAVDPGADRPLGSVDAPARVQSTSRKWCPPPPPRDRPLRMRSRCQPPLRVLPPMKSLASRKRVQPLAPLEQDGGGPSRLASGRQAATALRWMPLRSGRRYRRPESSPTPSARSRQESSAPWTAVEPEASSRQQNPKHGRQNFSRVRRRVFRSLMRRGSRRPGRLSHGCGLGRDAHSDGLADAFAARRQHDRPRLHRAHPAFGGRHRHPRIAAAPSYAAARQRTAPPVDGCRDDLERSSRRHRRRPVRRRESRRLVRERSGSPRSPSPRRGRRDPRESRRERNEIAVRVRPSLLSGRRTSTSTGRVIG